MRKELVIISLIGLCLAFSVAEKNTRRNRRDSDGPESNVYKDVDVNNPRVQAAAFQVLTVMQAKKEGCSNAVLIGVTDAKHRLYSKTKSEGTEYQLKLSFKTADDGEIKTCEVTVWGSEKYPLSSSHYAVYKSCKCTD